MRLVVLGAAGGTGRQVVAHALTAGHEVTAVARSAEALAEFRSTCAVVTADVLRIDTLRAAIEGADAVAYAVGAPNRSTTVVYSDGIRNVLDTMRDTGVKRIVTISSARIEVPKQAPLVRRMMIRYVVEKIFRNTYLDMLRMEDELRHSDVIWTMIRSSGLCDGAATGAYRTTAEGYLSHERPLRRADLADYLVKHIDDADTHRAVVTISG
jgi:putative NADH-flavin reductase